MKSPVKCREHTEGFQVKIPKAVMAPNSALKGTDKSGTPVSHPSWTGIAEEVEVCNVHPIFSGLDDVDAIGVVKVVSKSGDLTC